MNPRKIAGTGQHGFTLVELATVLTIIALILAGILIGKQMVQRSQAMAVVTEVESFQQAFDKFWEKYKELPGDMIDGYAFFDLNATNLICGTNVDINGNAAGCNGDGNGVIASPRESLRGWQHLQLAGFLSAKGTFYTGISSVPTFNPGTNVPPSQAATPLSGPAGYKLATGTVYTFTGHYAQLGANVANNLTGGVLTTADALAVDQKMDDGLAITGRVLAQNDAANGCVAANIYIRTESTATACNMVFQLGTQ